MQTPLIEFRKVSKRFDGKPVLDRVDLSVYPGQVTTLIGKSGVGKSVTLKLIIGLLDPDSGQILFEGRDIGRMSRKERRQMRERFNFMFQHNALFDSMTVFENIALPLQEKTRLNKRDIEERVRSKLESLDLLGIEFKYPSQISGGMQKRVALARALISDPQVVLFDEPTTGLDPMRKNSVLSMITHNQRNFGFTAILVSHDVPDVLYISNRVAIIEQNRIIYEGSPHGLEQSQQGVVKEFIYSLEALKKDICGLPDRSELEKAYMKAVHAWHTAGTFGVLVFRIKDYRAIEEEIGEFGAFEVLNTLAERLRSYVGSWNYIYGRYDLNTIVCLLPGLENKEACEPVLWRLAEDLQAQTVFQPNQYTTYCYEFSVVAGCIIGSDSMQLDELVQAAQPVLKTLVRLSCAQTTNRGSYA
jgi:phospholipid/cholesterol/gamma-HCH transport system ATP-binding protein